MMRTYWSTLALLTIDGEFEEITRPSQYIHVDELSVTVNDGGPSAARTTYPLHRLWSVRTEVLFVDFAHQQIDSDGTVWVWTKDDSEGYEDEGCWIREQDVEVMA